MMRAHLSPDIDRYRWSPAPRASSLAFSSRALLSSVSLQWRSRTLACDTPPAPFPFPFGSIRQALRGCSLGARTEDACAAVLSSVARWPLFPLGCLIQQGQAGRQPRPPFPDVHVLWPAGATQARQPARRRPPPALPSPCPAGIRSTASSPGCTTAACAPSSVPCRRPSRRLARSAAVSRSFVRG